MKADRALTLRVLALLPAIALSLRLFGLRRVYLFLLGRSEARRPTDHIADPAEAAERIAAGVMRVNRRLLPYESRCLTESLALFWVLRRAGIPAVLVLGVRTIMGPFEAHAWVEWNDRALNDVPGVRGIYEAFDIGAWTAEPSASGHSASGA